MHTQGDAYYATMCAALAVSMGPNTKQKDAGAQLQVQTIHTQSGPVSYQPELG